VLADDGVTESYFAYFVLRDEDFPTAFVTADAEKAEEARRMLTSAFGEDRVSVMSFGESSIDEYAEAIRLWKDMGL